MDKCPNCGNNVYETDKRCSKCGEPLSKNKFSKKIIAVIAIVVILAIVGVLVSGMLASDNSTTDVKTQSDTVDPITYDNDAAVKSSEYWASAKAEKFHLPTCEWAQKISEDNKIVYHSRDDAIADGRIPCGECNP